MTVLQKSLQRTSKNQIFKDMLISICPGKVCYLSQYEKTVKRTRNALSSLVDKWIVFVISEFVSATIGFAWGLYTRSILFLFIGGFFFSLGVFAATRLGFDRWRAKKRPARRRK